MTIDIQGSPLDRGWFRWAVCFLLSFVWIASPAESSSGPLELIHYVATPDTTAMLPFGNLTSLPSIQVAWGDSGVDSNVTATSSCPNNTYCLQHTYANAGNYTIQVSGSGVAYFGWVALPSVPMIYITDMVSFGNIGVASLAFALARQPLLQTVPAELPFTVVDLASLFENTDNNSPNITSWNVVNVTRMASMFSANSLFNQPIDGWNVSSVTTMSRMFAKTTFNQSLASWDTRNVNSFSYMFSNSPNFQQDISSWNTSSARTIASMFEFSNFNGLIGSWDTSRVTLMNSVFFRNRQFNQSIGAWNISQVTTINYMFYSASSFNRPLNSWDTKSLRSISETFNGATSFNQPLDRWNTASIVDMSYAFAGADAFNQNLSSWDTRAVIYFSSAFNGASSFNGDVSSWKLSKVTNFNSVFEDATAFNQPLSTWDLSKATTMADMFRRAVSFNQDIESWNVSSTSNMDNIFNGATSFNRSLAYWCVRQISSAPIQFALNSALSPALHPQWGQCPSKCVQPPPAYAQNATCVSGSWVFSVPACQFFGTCASTSPSGQQTFPPTSGAVSLPTGTVIRLEGNASVAGVTLIIPVQPGSTPGKIQADSCLSLTGDVVVTISDSAVPLPGSTIEILTSSRPECFDVQLNKTVTIVVEGSGCSNLTGTTGQSATSTTKSIFVLFALDASGCVTTPGFSPTNSTVAAESNLIGPIAGGVAGGVALLTMILIVVLFFRHRSRTRAARIALRRKVTASWNR